MLYSQQPGTKKKISVAQGITDHLDKTTPTKNTSSHFCSQAQYFVGVVTLFCTRAKITQLQSANGSFHHSKEHPSHASQI
jgi:hypothetical protein